MAGDQGSLLSRSVFQNASYGLKQFALANRFGKVGGYSQFSAARAVAQLPGGGEHHHVPAAEAGIPPASFRPGRIRPFPPSGLPPAPRNRAPRSPWLPAMRSEPENRLHRIPRRCPSFGAFRSARGDWSGCRPPPARAALADVPQERFGAESRSSAAPEIAARATERAALIAAGFHIQIRPPIIESCQFSADGQAQAASSVYFLAIDPSAWENGSKTGSPLAPREFLILGIFHRKVKDDL